MSYNSITLPDQISSAIKNHPAALFYFSAPSCNVCKVLKPKIAEMIQSEFPEMKLFYVDIEKAPLISGQFQVFTIPTIIIYFDAKEFIRKSRNIGIFELREEIERPYKMLFDKE